MIRRVVAFAGLGAAAVIVAAPAPAAACDPNKFPYCQQSYCAGVAVLYGDLSDYVDPAPPPWPRTGVAGCP